MIKCPIHGCDIGICGCERRSAPAPCSVEPTSRQVIEGKLLAALDDKSKVAILATEADLNMLIDALLPIIAEQGIHSKAYEYRRDLMQLKTAAFH